MQNPRKELVIRFRLRSTDLEQVGAECDTVVTFSDSFVLDIQRSAAVLLPCCVEELRIYCEFERLNFAVARRSLGFMAFHIQ